MAEQFLMAIDAGTGSVRAVLFDPDGNQIGCVQKEWEHKEDPRYPGSMDFDWVHNWKLACECTNGVIEETKIKPEQWVKTVKAAGMTGLILTCKHHDGFCLWNTGTTDFNVMNSPMGKDIVKAVSD